MKPKKTRLPKPVPTEQMFSKQRNQHGQLHPLFLGDSDIEDLPPIPRKKLKCGSPKAPPTAKTASRWEVSLLPNSSNVSNDSRRTQIVDIDAPPSVSLLPNSSNISKDSRRTQIVDINGLLSHSSLQPVAWYARRENVGFRSCASRSDLFKSFKSTSVAEPSLSPSFRSEPKKGPESTPGKRKLEQAFELEDTKPTISNVRVVASAGASYKSVASPGAKTKLWSPQAEGLRCESAILGKIAKFPLLISEAKIVAPVKKKRGRPKESKRQNPKTAIAKKPREPTRRQPRRGREAMPLRTDLVLKACSHVLARAGPALKRSKRAARAERHLHTKHCALATLPFTSNWSVIPKRQPQQSINGPGRRRAAKYFVDGKRFR